MGVLVERSGEVTFVPAELDREGAMQTEAVALANVVRGALASADDFEALPAGLGPHVIAGQPVAMPISVTDDWFAEKVLRAA